MKEILDSESKDRYASPPESPKGISDDVHKKKIMKIISRERIYMILNLSINKYLGK